MTETRVGRLLAACLHQAITDELPDRLEFYEHWLRSDALRGGALGRAAFSAVTGFLRTEGPAYDAVMARAGTLAAIWYLESVSALRRRAVAMLPSKLRARAASRIAAAVVRSTSGLTRASARLRHGQVRLDVTSSLFCQVREPQAGPLCRFHLAVLTEVLRRFGIAASGRIERCGAVQPGSCLMVAELDAVRAADPAMAA